MDPEDSPAGVEAQPIGAGGPVPLVIAGAGYAGQHVALRLSGAEDKQRLFHVTLVDRHPFQQVITELPRVAGGTRAADAVRLPIDRMLGQHAAFVQADITGFDINGRRLLTSTGPLAYLRVVLALGSRPNDFAIPGLSEQTIALYSVEDAERIRVAVQANIEAAAHQSDPELQRRLVTAVIGGGGATGVELAGELAETMPELARRHGLAADLPSVILVDAGPTILAGSSTGLIQRAERILADLHVQVRTKARIARATTDGLQLADGELIRGGVFVWAGGVKAPEVIAQSGLPTGHNGRLKVDEYLRVLDHPDVYAGGDVASVVDLTTGHVLPPLARIALDEGEAIAHKPGGRGARPTSAAIPTAR